jgi:uncharacterized SAM-binding protein YcdF (DUF218 family)
MSRDLRKYARQTNVRLIVGAVLLLLVVGDGLIYLIYGQGAAFLGLFCLLAAVIPIALTLIVLVLLDWISKRADRD